jgi:hypothetical protein
MLLMLGMAGGAGIADVAEPVSSITIQADGKFLTKTA